MDSRRSGLLAVPAVDHNSDRAIIDESNFHRGAETPPADGPAQMGIEEGTEMLIERISPVGSGGAQEGRAVAFPGAGVEGELADDNGLSIVIDERAVHPALAVVEDAHVCNLSREPFGVPFCVGVLEAEENKQTTSDGSDYFAFHGDRGF